MATVNNAAVNMNVDRTTKFFQFWVKLRKLLDTTLGFYVSSFTFKSYLILTGMLFIGIFGKSTKWELLAYRNSVSCV